MPSWRIHLFYSDSIYLDLIIPPPIPLDSSPGPPFVPPTNLARPVTAIEGPALPSRNDDAKPPPDHGTRRNAGLTIAIAATAAAIRAALLPHRRAVRRRRRRQRRDPRRAVPRDAGITVNFASPSKRIRLAPAFDAGESSSKTAPSSSSSSSPSSSLLFLSLLLC